MEELLSFVEWHLYALRSLTVQLQELEKKKRLVSHALLNKDNAGILFQMEGLPDSFEGLQDLLGSLIVQVDEIENKKNEVLQFLLSKDNVISKAEPTVRDIIIAFVEEIEKAHQYYDFLLYLNQHDLVKPEDDAVDMLQHLVQVKKVHELPQFNKLEFKQILDALEVCIRDQRIIRRHGRLVMQGHASSEAFPETKNDWYSLVSAKVQEKQLGELELGEPENPILSLVYYIREKGHVMDENPLVELSHIFEFDEVFYKVCFVSRLIWKLSEKEVWVPFVPLDLAENLVEDDLSLCGKIEAFEMLSPEPGCSTKTARVTFEDSEAAKIAPLLMTRNSMRPWAFVKPVHVHEKYEYQPKDITEYDKALIKYKGLRNYSKKMSN